MKTIIFGGTTEGREQAALALARGESVLVSVTSEYARQFLPEGAACHIGALDEAAMKAWIAAERPERVIDATHPFAVRATQTIRACADALHIPYTRIERAEDRREDWRDAVTWAGDSEEAAALAARCKWHAVWRHAREAPDAVSAFRQSACRRASAGTARSSGLERPSRCACRES